MADLRWCTLVEAALREFAPDDEAQREVLLGRLRATEDYRIARAQLLAGASDRVICELLRRPLNDMTGTETT